MSDATGPPSRIGPYPVEREVGRGGMGIVYLARDTRLDRPVAIKVLPETLAGDPERLARFEREARLLASLNHPNIASIHGIEEADGRRFLTLEYVEGETLAERIARGPLPVDDATDVCRQIAAALEAAHEAGVIHRDLKPGNVKLTPGGEVKVLDFGLAKGSAGGSSASGPEMTQSPTMSLSMTGAGVILGTAAYMSPEQARGKAVDRRTDIWSFGCVLFECLTGKQAFAGETISDVVALILQGEPDWKALPANVPPRMRELLERCLTKDAKRRLRDIGEARLVLEGGAVTSASSSSAGTAAAPPGPRVPGLAYGIIGALAVATAVLGWMAATRGGPAEPVTRLTVSPPHGRFVGPDPVFSAISPDGTLLVFACFDSGGGSSLWLRPLDSMEARELPGTQGGLVPLWSPDSRTIAFFIQDRLKKVSVRGGNPETICPIRSYGRGGSWSARGVIVFAAGGEGPLFQVSADGGEPRQVSTLDSSETGHRFPRFLPDGRRFLYSSMPPRGNVFDIYVGSLDGGRRQKLMTADGTPIYVEPGYLMYSRNGRLVAQRFDAGGLRLRGATITLNDEPGGTDWMGGVPLSASAGGPLAYVRRPWVNTDLIWFDRAGHRLGRVTAQEGRYENVTLSPDGKRAALVMRTSTIESDLWILELERGTMSRFTFGPGRVDNPVWSPDGSRIAYSGDRAGRWDIYVKAVSGAAPEEAMLTGGSLLKYPTSWSRDGRCVLYNQIDEKTGWDIWVLPMEGDRTPRPYIQAPFDQQNGAFSPDGRWVAYESYESGESGRAEVYVQAFPTPGQKHQVSSAGGQGARWRADGREMAFASLTGPAAFADVETGAEFRSGIPHPALSIPNAVYVCPTFDFSRLIASVPVGEGNAAATLVVVSGWRREVEK